ncbi:MAG: PEGA domain-containing protein, partial [bacterium]
MALLNGCATLFHGPKQAIEVTSQPRGAVIALDGRAVGITPASVNVERSQQHMTLRYTKEGYNPDEIGLRREFNWLTPIEDYGGCFAFTF